MAIDAFNGTLLWRREIPGAVRVKIKSDSGNLVITKTGLYVAVDDRCLRLHPATGATMRVYEMPTDGQEGARRWGYISVIDDILYGSTAKAMDWPYAALLKCCAGDVPRNSELVPPRYRQVWERFRNQYPDRKSLTMAAERNGLLYLPMTAFANGGEFTQKNAVTANLMTSDRIFEDYLEDILEYAEKAVDFLEEVPTLDALKRDERTLLAVVRALEVIGEAAKRIPQDFRDRYPNIPWRGMSGMRDKVVHEYFGVDTAVVWRTVREDLPILCESIAQALSDLKTEQGGYE
jgi:uncharacterized protein with HEPN domain